MLKGIGRREKKKGDEMGRISDLVVDRTPVREDEFEDIVGKAISSQFGIPLNLAKALAGRYMELKAKEEQGIYDPWGKDFKEENKEIIKFIERNFEIIW